MKYCTTKQVEKDDQLRTKKRIPFIINECMLLLIFLNKWIRQWEIALLWGNCFVCNSDFFMTKERQSKFIVFVNTQIDIGPFELKIRDNLAKNITIMVCVSGTIFYDLWLLAPKSDGV